jgi:hypothetical protein
MFSYCKGDFEDVAMPHNIDELLEAVGFSTDIDAILDSTDDSEVSLTPQPPISLTILLISLVSLAT